MLEDNLKGGKSASHASVYMDALTLKQVVNFSYIIQTSRTVVIISAFVTSTQNLQQMVCGQSRNVPS
jgi:hypothetical protein